jgi:large subunit ribosomal protein L4
MAKVALYNMEGTKTGDMEVSDAIFAAEVNKSVLHQVVVNYLANQRQGTQSTKTRTEVRGGGIKPWRQKGTGRARQGSIRAPQWTGGGVALGPKPRSYRFSVNKKIKRIALKSALSAKYADYKIFVIDELAVDEIKTAKIVALLKGLDVNSKALIVTADADENLQSHLQSSILHYSMEPALQSSSFYTPYLSQQTRKFFNSARNRYGSV